MFFNVPIIPRITSCTSLALGPVHFWNRRRDQWQGNHSKPMISYDFAFFCMWVQSTSFSCWSAFEMPNSFSREIFKVLVAWHMVAGWLVPFWDKIFLLEIYSSCRSLAFWKIAARCKQRALRFSELKLQGLSGIQWTICWIHNRGSRPVSKHACVKVVSSMAMVQHLPATLTFRSYSFWEPDDMSQRQGMFAPKIIKTSNCLFYRKPVQTANFHGVWFRKPGVCYWIPLPFWTASILGALDHPIWCHFMRSKWFWWFCHVVFFLWSF